MVGFNLNDNEEKKHPTYDRWKGRFGHFPVDHSTIIGCLQEIDISENIVKFCPYIVYVGSKARIEREEPAEFDFKVAHFKGIIPLTGGEADLEDIAAQNNKEYFEKNPEQIPLKVYKR